MRMCARCRRAAIVDFVVSLVLIFWFRWFKAETDRNIEDQDGDMISMADYSIQACTSRRCTIRSIRKHGAY